MIICKRPVPPVDHLQPQKGHEKSIFETLHNDIKCVLGIKESKFNGKNRSTFSHLLSVRPVVADPATPYSQPDRKISVFLHLLLDFP